MTSLEGDISMNAGEVEEEEPKLTKTERRIVELKDVEENIAILLNLAGCTIASLHPDPLATFSSSIVSLDDSPDSDDDDDDDDEDKKVKEPSIPTDQLSKEDQFNKYAEAYYSTLFDIQRSLRTSIRHLRLSRASPAPLLDPNFASLSNAGARIGAGGVASAELLKPLPLRSEMLESKATMEEIKPRKSVGALRFEKEAIEDLIKAMTVS